MNSGLSDTERPPAKDEWDPPTVLHAATRHLAERPPALTGTLRTLCSVPHVVNGEKWIRDRLKFLRDQLSEAPEGTDARAAIEAESRPNYCVLVMQARAIAST